MLEGKGKLYYIKVIDTSSLCGLKRWFIREGGHENVKEMTVQKSKANRYQVDVNRY